MRGAIEMLPLRLIATDILLTFALFMSVGSFCGAVLLLAGAA